MFPLGPFNGKNFATTVSPWIVTLDALKPFKTSMPDRVSRERCPLPDREADGALGWMQEESAPLADYLVEKDDKPTFDLPLTMDIKGEYSVAADLSDQRSA